MKKLFIKLSASSKTIFPTNTNSCLLSNFFIITFFFFQPNGNGSDSCSCATGGEDCTSERVRFDDSVSYIASHSYESEKASIGSSCSFRARCGAKPALARADKVGDTLSNDFVYIDIVPNEEKPKKRTSITAALRSQFFHSSLNENKSKSLDDKTIIEVSNEALNTPKRNEDKARNSSASVIESSKL